MEKYFQLTKTEGNKAELFIYGDIADIPWFKNDVSSFDIAQQLCELEAKELTVRINSYGGSVSQGLAIYNLLKSLKDVKVKTICDGFACSIASVILMSGQEREMRPTSLLMIHNPWTYVEGNAAELKKQAEDLEKITIPSIEAYKNASKLSEEKIREMMDNETWFTAQEALDCGFITSITDSQNQKQALQDKVMNDLVIKNKELSKKLVSYEKRSSDPKPSKGWFF